MSVKMKYFTLLLFAAHWATSAAQITLTNQVTGSLGHHDVLSGTHEISGTAGEGIVHTKSASRYCLTQGFHQPFSTGAIDFSVLTTDASCPASTDGAARVDSISGCSPPYAVTWSTGSTGSSVDRLSTGTYAVTVTAGQCSFTRQFTIGAGPDEFCKLTFFNAFSPNGDGLNDRWTIENITRPEFSDNHIEIFNRWGQTVWSGSGYNNSEVAWDGATKKGNKLPDGTYFYVAKVAETVYKGYIELTR